MVAPNKVINTRKVAWFLYKTNVDGILKNMVVVDEKDDSISGERGVYFTQTFSASM